MAEKPKRNEPKKVKSKCPDCTNGMVRKWDPIEKVYFGASCKKCHGSGSVEY